MLRAVDPKRLARLLEDSALAERLTIDQALSKLQKGETLADRLVEQGSVKEGDLLRVMAQELKVRFVSSPRLADLRVLPEVLGLVPADFALKHAVLPLALNVEAQALSVAMADPSKVAALDDLPKVGGLAHVVPHVAMPGAIRAAVRRLYGLEDEATTRAKRKAEAACSQCGEPYFEDQLECACCGLLLNPHARVENTEIRIVRALLSEPTGMHRMLTRNQVHDGATRVGHAILVTDEQVLELAPGFAAVRALAEFEADLVSYVDGVASVAEVTRASGLTAIETRSVMTSLIERKVLRPKAPAAVPPPAPVVAAPVGVPARPATSPGLPSPVARPAAGIPSKSVAAFVPGAPVSAAPPAPPAPGAAARPETSPGQKAVPRHLRPEVQMENSIQAALQLERRGEVDGAIKVLEIAIARASNPAALYNRLGLVMLHQRKDVAAAERYLKKAQALEPQNPVYSENLRKLVVFAASF